MMTRGPARIGALTCIGILVSMLLPAGQRSEDVELFRVRASIRPQSLSRGEEGHVVLRVTLQEGITVNPHPAFTIEFNPSEELIFPKSFYTNSDLNIPVIEDGEYQYLDMAKPIEIPFTVSLRAKRGSHVLSGKVKYFVCSNEEGWCYKDKAEFSVSFFTRQLRIKKRPRP